MALPSSSNSSSSFVGSTSIPSIERLLGRENWTSWKFAAKTFLQLEGLWEVVKPVKKEDGTFETVDEKKDLQARLKLILLLDPTIYVHIEDAESARSAWDKLEMAFEDKGLSRQIGLLHKLIKSDLDTCGSMNSYVNQVISTANQLNAIGFKLPDLWVGMILLAGLPEEYRPMILAMENSGVAITGDYVKTKLLQERPLLRNENVQALATNKRREVFKPKQKPSSSKGPQCRKCGRYGHIAKFCKDDRKGGTTLCTVLSTFGNSEANEWILDSAAYAHMTSNKDLLSNLQNATGKVVAANGGTLDIVARGTAIIQPKCMEEIVTISDVKLIPGLTSNLLSVSRMVEKGYTVQFNTKGCKVYNPSGKLVLTGIHNNNQFKVEQVANNMQEALSCNTAESFELWHKRMGHLGAVNLKKLAGGLATGITLKNMDGADCRVCPLGKHSKLPFPKKGSRAENVLDLVHSDINGPMETHSLGGHRYYITFIDDKTRRIFVYFLKTKSEVEVFEAFKRFHAMAERQSGRKLKTLRTDNGKEYMNKSLTSFLQKEGIRHETSNGYTPQQNGLAERANRTIVEMARCLLFEGNMTKGFWAEAVSTAVYLINRSPTRGHNLTPEEAWNGRKPDLSHLRVFGTKAMVMIPKEKRRKWDPKSHECVLTGFDEETKGYRLYDHKKKQTIISREVIFLDEGCSSNVTVTAMQEPRRTFVRLDIEETTSIQPVQIPVPNFAPDAGSDSTLEENDAETDGELDESTTDDENNTSTETMVQSEDDSSDFLGFSGSDVDGFVAVASGMYSGTYADPVSHQEALARDDSKEWGTAMQEEYNALMENKTWTLTSLPKGRQAIKCKWVYRTKCDSSGNLTRYKARLVVKGFSQRKGEDYDETYAPVVRYCSLRYLFALAIKHDLMIDQMDAVTAFLQGDLDEDIYMEQPPCFVDGQRKTLVCKLNKAIYGLKQASRVWNNKLDAALQRFGLIPTQYDPCVYVGSEGGKIIIVAIYVDDMMIFSNDVAWKKQLKKHLCSCFRMKDLGAAQHCLGIRIQRTKETIKLDQEIYIESILKRFNMDKCKPVAVPMNNSEKLTKEESPKSNNETAAMKDVPYQEAVGCLMYLAQSTRPDILYAVNMLSRFNKNPGQKHWNGVKHVMRYLRGTSNFKLVYKKNVDSKIIGYCDADWGSDPDERKSTTGNIFMAQGGAISWMCKKQPTVALSTCEAEYMSVSAAVQEASWWRGLSAKLANADEVIEIRCDNQSCIAIAKNGGYHPRTKHIDIRHHFIKDALSRGIVTLEYVSTEDQIADGLTKPLQRTKFEISRELMGISEA